MTAFKATLTDQSLYPIKTQFDEADLNKMNSYVQISQYFIF